MRTNKKDREVFMKLFKGLESLWVAIMRSVDDEKPIEEIGDYQLGIAQIIRWLKDHPIEFEKYYKLFEGRE